MKKKNREYSKAAESFWTVTDTVTDCDTANILYLPETKYKVSVLVLNLTK